MDLDQILSKITHQKSLTPQTITLLKSHLSSHKISSLALWKMNSAFRLLLNVGRFQLFLLAGTGLTVFPYMMYEKYLEEPEKIKILAGITPVVSMLMLAPLVYFRRFYSRLLKEISYDVVSRELVLKGFSKNNVRRVRPEDVKAILTKNGRVQKIEVQIEGQGKGNGQQGQRRERVKIQHSIQGQGVWESIQVFKHILNKREL